MPLYELFALAKPALERSQQAEVIRNAAKVVFNGGGVLLDIKSYDERETAYTIRPPHEAYDSAFTWQLSFQASPAALKALEHALKVDERMLRYIVHKRKLFERLPSTYKVAKRAAATIQDRHQQDLTAMQKNGTPLWWDPQGCQDDPPALLDPEGASPQHSPLFKSTLSWLAQHQQDRLSNNLVWDQAAESETNAERDAPESVQPAEGSFPNPAPAEQAVEESTEGAPQPL